MSGKSCETCADIGKASCAECDDCHQWQPRVTRREESKGIIKVPGGLNYYVVEIGGVETGYALRTVLQDESYKYAVSAAVELTRRTKQNYYVMAIRAKIVHVSERIVSVDEIPLWTDH